MLTGHVRWNSFSAMSRTKRCARKNVAPRNVSQRTSKSTVTSSSSSRTSFLFSRPETKVIWKSLKTELKIWEYFLFLTEIPRPSGKLNLVTTRIMQHVADYMPKVTAFRDNVGNILLRKPASVGMEKKAGVCIQGHLDMVTTTIDGHDFDFEKEAIVLQLSDDFLKADRTTLGADNGIGVAAGLALLADDTMSYPMLECLFTVDEETTMQGAEELPPDWLQSTIFINCDSEEEKSICVGCAGGQENIITLPITSITSTIKTSDNSSSYCIKLTGCKGGHSGCSIHEGLMNAGKSMNRMLLYAMEKNVSKGCYLAEYSSGNAANAIPSSAQVVLVGSVVSTQEWISSMQSCFQTICDEYLSIEGSGSVKKGDRKTDLKLIVTKQETIPNVVTSDVQKIVDLVNMTPHGVMRMSPDIKDLVETSTSMAFLKLDLHATVPSFQVHNFTRSSRESALTQSALDFTSMSRCVGAVDSGIFNYFPGWNPNLSSPALAACKEVHQEVHGSDPLVYSVHAGLESGFILKKYPNMDCISIGPLIENAHTVQERMLVPSVKRFWRILQNTVQRTAGIETD